MIKVSVIIPIYNVENYIEKCAISLFEQTMDDIEYIFVNDGSTDNSLETLNQIICRYPNRQKDVKIISFNQNKGLHEATRIGFSSISGEYFIRCDSDDWLSPDAYSIMYETAVNGDADIVECGYNLVYNNGQ